MNESLPSYFLKRSARSRHVRVTVVAGGRVLVSAPSGVSEAVIQAFLLSKAEWLVEKIQYFNKFPEQKIGAEAEKKIFATRKAEAFALAEAKIKQWNKHYGFVWSKLMIRNSRSRWGSCSSKGTLSFNYKIVFLPEGLLDYLVVHELCHLEEANHGKAFWALVAKAFPDHALSRRSLRQFEKTLELEALGV